MEKKKDIVLCKQQAVIDMGYACEIWVYDGKGNNSYLKLSFV
jgi:hypothetical protein